MKEYEYVQVQVYLKLLGLEEAKLIEQYNAETSTHEIIFDKKFINEVVLPEVQAFANRLNTIFTSKEAREEYILKRDIK